MKSCDYNQDAECKFMWDNKHIIDAYRGGYVDRAMYLIGERKPNHPMPMVINRVHYRDTKTFGWLCLYQIKSSLGMWFTHYIYNIG